MSTEDGPGIRTTVFFKGCSLACTWCHNPESIDRAPRVIWKESDCIRCHSCEEICPNGALDHGPHGNVIDPLRCRDCGTCTDACPAAALDRLGTSWDLDDLVTEVARDRVFFEESGGGVTASGGEPALWSGFVATLFERCRDMGLHTALDTCGMCSDKALAAVASQSDLVLYDLKEIDPDKHRRFTGRDNAKILQNLKALTGALSSDKRLWIRTPLIPGATATRENILGLGRFIAGELDGAVGRWELCAFNNLCRQQYRRLGNEWEFDRTKLLTGPELEAFEAVARSSGVDPTIVAGTGPTRLE